MTPASRSSLSCCILTLVAAVIAFLSPAAQAAPDRTVELRSEVAGNPAAAPSVITRAFQPASAVTPQRALEVTTAVIEGLGSSPAGHLVGQIVHAGVLAAPDRVLEIVRAAVIAAPAEAADEITASAVAALKDPWRMVVYERAGAPVQQGERDFKGEPDFKSPVDNAEQASTDPGIPMTLAEAVVHTALAARAGLNAIGIYAAVELVLRSAPGWAITAIYSPKGISGVGEAGNNNYANEPFRPFRRGITLTPDSDPVSR